MEDTLLEIRNLETYFYTDDGTARSVDGMDLTIRGGRTPGVIGESGCGKSVTALSVLRLVASPPGRIVAGEILFEGQNLLDKSPAQMRAIRGNEISMIFQEPMTSLNPVYTIGNQIMESIILHQGLKKAEARRKAVEIFTLVGIPSSEKRVDEYPHQLSGGMRQRAMIAIALACRPKLLIADEPTTALDVTIQAQILRLINDLKHQIGMAVMMITHDLGVVAQVADDVVVAYAGQGVEYGDVKAVFDRPAHPYTRALLSAVPIPDPSHRVDQIVLTGEVPSPINPPSGCRFRTCCFMAQDLCGELEPPLREIVESHFAACHFA